jgi:hypothetical protein
MIDAMASSPTATAAAPNAVAGFERLMPPFSRLRAMFDECCDVVTVLDRYRPIAAVMNFYCRDEVLAYYGGARRRLASVLATTSCTGK